MFLFKLHYLLSQETSAIRWTFDGTAIRIIDKDVLLKDYLPLYFNQKSFASFRHQLSTYGFIKIKKGPNVDCYYHPDFSRDLPGLVLTIRRAPPKCRRVRLNGKLMRIPLDEALDNGMISSASSDEHQHCSTVASVANEDITCDSSMEENGKTSTDSSVTI